MESAGLTIGRLARAADVGIETVRYYQRRSLLPVPETPESTFRHYPAALVNRIRFIKRAQELGFSLDEVSALLALEDGRNRQAIRQIATSRLDQVRGKIEDLQRMEHALAHLVHDCEATGHATPCPIIAALAGDGDGLAPGRG